MRKGTDMYTLSGEFFVYCGNIEIVEPYISIFYKLQKCLHKYSKLFNFCVVNLLAYKAPKEINLCFLENWFHVDFENMQNKLELSSANLRSLS